MGERGISRRDSAALAYFAIRLRGRSSRLRRKWRSASYREPLLLNETFLDGQKHLLDNVPDESSPVRYQQVLDRMSLRSVMGVLTDREARLLCDLYWRQKTVTQVCGELGVSKNSVLKMKRNALRKLRQELAEKD